MRGIAAAVLLIGGLALLHGSVLAWSVAVACGRGCSCCGLRALASRPARRRRQQARGRLHVLHLGFEDPDDAGRRWWLAGAPPRPTAGWPPRPRVTVLTTRFPGARDRTGSMDGVRLRWSTSDREPAATGSPALLGYVLPRPRGAGAGRADLVVEDFFAPVSSMRAPRVERAPTVGVVQWLNAREKARQYRLPVHLVERLAVRSHRRSSPCRTGVAAKLAGAQPGRVDRRDRQRRRRRWPAP